MTGRILLVLALIALAVPVFGAASGLNIIPTADVLDKGAAAVEIEQAGEQAHIFTTADTALLLQLGLGGGVEIGYDKCGDGDSFGAWNIKLAVARRNGLPSAAIGVQNVGNGIKPQPYAVGHITLGCGRLHAGLIRIEGSTQPMIGYDRPLAKLLTLQSDYVAGDENAASLGFAVDLGSNLGLTAAYIRNNIGPDKDSYLLTLSWLPSF